LISGDRGAEGVWPPRAGSTVATSRRDRMSQYVKMSQSLARQGMKREAELKRGSTEVLGRFFVRLAVGKESPLERPAFQAEYARGMGPIAAG
jgi:hypothetical protein